MAPYSGIKVNPARVRSWMNRLPFATRVMFFVIVAFGVGSMLQPWLVKYCSLIPTKVSLWAAHRLSIYPFVHNGLFHTILGVLAFVPLLERFEAENGTIVTFALFFGPFTTIPGILYILIDHVILRANTAVYGTGVWVFLLLGIETFKISRTNPYLTVATLKLPTRLMPLLLLLLLHFLVPSPSTSLIANSSAFAVGDAFEGRYLRFLVPPERALRFVEGKLDLLVRLPHYVSVDQKTFGRYGVLPSSSAAAAAEQAASGAPVGRSFIVGGGGAVGPATSAAVATNAGGASGAGGAAQAKGI